MATTLWEVDGLMIPLDGVMRNLDGVVDSSPPEKGCEVLDGELTQSNGMKMAVKISLIVMMPTFY